MVTQEDIEFGKKALAQGFINSETLSKCLKIQAQWQQQKKYVLLADLLVYKKILHSSQVEQIKNNPTHSQETFDSSSVSTALSLGSMFCHYQIQEILGRGGMGIVYKALDTRLNRTIALKLLISGYITPIQTQRFIQEATATAQLQHPHIVKLFEVSSQPTHYFTMEYIPGSTLYSLIYKNQIRPEQIADIFQKSALALDYIHQKEIIHRDIKPQNIMINEHGEPKIMDFGVAKLTQNETSLSQTGNVIGTPTYMSPQQANGERVDKLADIYSLGATLYETLVGRPPFQGHNHLNILNQVLTQDPISPRSLNPDVPIELEAICLKCLQKNPKMRYKDAAQLAQDIDNYLQNDPILASVPGTWSHTKKFVKRHKFLCLIALGIFSSIFSMIVVYIVITQNHNTQLRLEKIKVEQEKIKVEREREDSIQAAKEIFKSLQKVYLKYENVRKDPELIQGLQRVFRELDRLNVIENLSKDQSHVAIYWLYGIVYGETKDFFKAMIAYNKIIATYPKNAKAYMNRGLLYKQQGNYAKAEQDFNLAIKYSVNPGYAYSFRAKLYQQQKLYKKANADYTKAIKMIPGNAILYTDMGLLYYEQKKYQLAEKYHTKALEINPMLFEAYVNRAIAHYYKKEYKKAHQDCSFVIKYNPKFAKAFKIRADINIKINKWQQAERDYKQAIALAPKTARTYFDLGNLYFLLGKFPQAENTYKKALQYDPSDADTHANIGNAQSKQKKYQLAKQSYERAIICNPKHKESYLNLGVLYTTMRMLPEAEKSYSKAIEIDNTAAKSYFKRGLFFANQRRFSLAKKDFDKVVALDPNHKEVYFNRGTLYATLGRFWQAERDFSKAIELNPNSGNALAARGFLYFQQKKYHRAIIDFKKSFPLVQHPIRKRAIQRYIELSKTNLQKK